MKVLALHRNFQRLGEIVSRGSSSQTPPDNYYIGFFNLMGRSMVSSSTLYANALNCIRYKVQKQLETCTGKILCTFLTGTKFC